MTSNISFIRTPSEEIFEKHRGLVKKTTMKRLRGWLILYAVLTVVALGMYRTGFFDLDRFISGFKQLGYMFKFMMPPAVNSSFFEFLGGIFETLAMAFLGTLLASIGALVIGFSAAKNIVSNRILHFTVRRGMDWVRGIDSLIWALVFIHVVGLGPFAGIMAIAVSDTATLSKMFSEAIENADPKPTEGILSAGGNKLQVVRFRTE